LFNGAKKVLALALEIGPNVLNGVEVGGVRGKE
jgi:hypothetical protein